MVKEFKNGISAIIPTYKGEKYISKLLDSLITQSISSDLFEAIFIVNGEPDSTKDIIINYQKKHPEINILLTESEKGVSNARNHGIEIAKREYTIFIDDDDYISENYFEELYRNAQSNRIVLGTYIEVDYESNEIIKDSPLTKSMTGISGIVENPYDDLRDAIVITTNKLIPTELVKDSAFNPELKNGVDISYYARFYPENDDLEFYLIDSQIGANYYYTYRNDSISRKGLSYDFNITDRLKVISDINEGIKKSKTPEMASFIKSMTGGQIYRINNYLKENPKDLDKVMDDINSYDFEFFPYKYLNEDFSLLNKENSQLVISYAFPPSSTTTGNAMAKKILKNKNNVDVIYASLNSLKRDDEFAGIIDEFLIRQFIIDLDFDNGWQNIREFSERGMTELETVGEYEKIYSMCYFPHSHFLALEYKLRHPNTFWSAEFSDPLIYNFEGKLNSSPINDYEYINRINEEIPDNYTKLTEEDTLNFICEYLTFIFADEIIFTNENQRKVMLEIFPHQEITDHVKEKSKIIPHNTLDEKYYHIHKSGYEVEKDCINFGYFGVIFGKRTLEDFVNALDNLDEKYKYRLHIFTPNITLFEQLLSAEVMENTVLNNEVDYLEFLSICKKLDVLLVNDTRTRQTYSINPFLPSKLSDYEGSGSDIWAICEEGSVMDNMEIRYKSRLNDIDSSVDTLYTIFEDRLNKKIDRKDFDKDEYYKKRISQLSHKIHELTDVALSEFQKDADYENRIDELNQINEYLENQNEEILNSNSWKLTKNLRKIGKKFK